MYGDKTEFLKDHMGTKSYVKYLIVLAILTKRKTEIILNSSYKITCSILRPNDHRCTERSISVLFVCHTTDVCEDQAQQCGLGIQFCRKFHKTVAVCYTRFLRQKNLKLHIVTFNYNKLLLKRFSWIILLTIWMQYCFISPFSTSTSTYSCKCGIPPLRGRECSRFVGAHGQKELQESEGPQKLTKFY